MVGARLGTAGGTKAREKAEREYMHGVERGKYPLSKLAGSLLLFETDADAPKKISGFYFL